jgi:hypothetical protein
MLLVVGLSASVQAKSIDLGIKVNQAEYMPSEKVFVELVLTNPGNKTLRNLTIMSRLEGDCIMRTYSRQMDLDAGKTLTLKAYDYEIKEYEKSGKCTIIAYVLQGSYTRIAYEEGAFLIGGTAKRAALTVNFCLEKPCQKPLRVFHKGETVYITYKADIPNLELTPTIRYPEGGEETIFLPASIKAEQTGTYEIISSIRREGYLPMEIRETFGVIEGEIRSGGVIGASTVLEEKKRKDETANNGIYALAIILLIISLALTAVIFIKKWAKKVRPE